jgi:ABC-type nitrate/sulfonate/bicarbonate transport system substrate-binding protein
MTARPLNVTVFPGGFNLPLWTGIARGCFSAQGLDVRVHYTTNSVEQLTGLIRGDWDIGLTGFDNVVAYQEGQGEAEIDREPDLFAFMGGDSSFLRLVVQPDIHSYADLQGKTLSVDALTTGFAFVLRAMLARNGIAEGDVRFERAGGVLQRFEALKAGRHAGTLLVTPFELLALEAGLRVLQNAAELFPHYQGVCGAARRGWAKENGDIVAGFIRGYVDALSWLYGRGNRPEACALLAEKVPNMTMELAAATCAILLADNAGFERQARLDMMGVKTVLELRSQYGRPQKALIDLRKYDDQSYYNEALQRS